MLLEIFLIPANIKRITLVMGAENHLFIYYQNRGNMHSCAVPTDENLTERAVRMCVICVGGTSDVPTMLNAAHCVTLSF